MPPEEESEAKRPKLAENGTVAPLEVGVWTISMEHMQIQALGPGWNAEVHAAVGCRWTLMRTSRRKKCK